MARSKTAWKNLERQIAKALGGKRISRGDNFARMDVDVEVPDLPELRIDGKYRTRHAHHTFMKEIMDKYCTDPMHEPVLVTKTHNQNGAYVTVSLEFFATLINCMRLVGKEGK